MAAKKGKATAKKGKATTGSPALDPVPSSKDRPTTSKATENHASEVTAFKQALKDLGIKTSDVFGYHEHSTTSIVIVTTSGKRMLWGDKPSVEMSFSKIVPCGGQNG